MSKVWAKSLLPSQVAFMNDIINQVPETAGARDAFIGCLQSLADKATSPKLRWYITDIGMCEIVGSNDEDIVKAFGESEDFFIVDTQTNTWDTMEVREAEDPR
jgi:hypothetical protein